MAETPRTVTIRARVEAPGILNALAEEAHSISVTSGWWSEFGAPGNGVASNTDASFLESLALIHSEVSEALERFRHGEHPADPAYSYHFDTRVPPPFEIRGEGNLLEYRTPGRAGIAEQLDREGWLPLTPEVALAYGLTVKPEGIPSELADIIIRVLDTCGAWGVDIDTAVRTKLEFNRSRPYRHGGKAL